jgi:phosphatidylserine/phosphatidylglycerophosphate/cardiolipin synthase-like enzyme
MIFSLFQSNSIFKSDLYNERTFYKQFLKDISQAKRFIQIESPFITSYRMEILLPIFQRLLNKGIRIKIITRDPVEHDGLARHQATNEILLCIDLGIEVVLMRGGHHRKLAIIDDDILWEGSLNILSQTRSKELMRRVISKNEVSQMMAFLSR